MSTRRDGILTGAKEIAAEGTGQALGAPWRGAAVAICLTALGSCGSEEPTPAASASTAPGAEDAQEASPIAAYPGGAIPEGLVPGTPNILIVTIDTLRADHLGFYGYPRPTSPTLDEIATDAVVFERAYAPVATTLPSHTSMFTGVYPHEHGVLANIADGQTYSRRAELSTLAQLFQSAGYRTNAVVSARPLDPSFELNVGFDRYEAPETKQQIAKDATDRGIAAIVEQNKQEAPGFLWVHYFDPHGAYVPPYQHARWFRMDDSMERYLGDRQFAERAQRPTGQWNELRPGFDGYDGEIHFVDQQIFRLLRKARATGWSDGAIVCFLADHGEGLNQHGVPGHGLTWEEHLHVPMMIRAPGLAARRLPWSVSIVDFAPTLLHLLDLEGKDAFLQQVTGVNRFRSDVRHGESRILGQSSPRQSNSSRLSYSLRADRWKLHMSEEGVVQLYDLEADPFELVDVADQNEAVVDSLRDELDRIVASQRRTVELRDATGEMKTDLDALGYGGNGR